MNDVDDLADRRSKLSPAKRELLAQRLRGKAAQTSAVSELLPIVRVSRDEPHPLTSPQLHMWRASRHLPNTSYYNIPINLSFEGTVEPAHIERALGAMIERHEVLRTLFMDIGDDTVQIVVPAEPYTLPRIDISDLPDEQRQERLYRLMVGFSHWRFDLTAGPLWKAALVQCSPTQYVLLMTMHHLLCDAWSNEIYTREMAALYDMFERGQTPEQRDDLPQLAVQFIDFVVWQRALRDSNAFETQIRYWQEQLTGSVLLHWPDESTRAPSRSFRYGLSILRFSDDLSERIRQVSTTLGMSPFMTCCAAVLLMLADHTGQHDIKLATMLANRTTVETEKIIGQFINEVIIRGRFEPTMTVQEVLHQTRQASLGAFMHQDVLYGQVMAALPPESRGVQVLFLYQNVGSGARLKASDVTVGNFWGTEEEIRDYEVMAVDCDLWIEIKEKPDGTMLILKYALDLFTAERGDALAQRMLDILERIVDMPAEPIGRWLWADHA